MLVICATTIQGSEEASSFNDHEDDGLATFAVKRLFEQKADVRPASRNSGVRDSQRRRMP